MASLQFNKDPFLLFSGLLILGAWYWTKQQDNNSDNNDSGLLTTIDDTLNEIKTMTGINSIKDAKPELLNNPNVKAFLMVIRTGEGTADSGGYKRLFGGGSFSSFADHPKKIINKSGYTTSAAGAYQFIISTWNETKKALKLPDFSPASQDLAALGRIAYRGALNDVIAGRFDQALRKVSQEWASMPYSPYGQPTISLAKANSTYLKNGGSIA